MTETLGSYSLAKNHSIWKFKIDNDEQLVQADFWDELYVVPAAQDPNNPMFQERHAMEYYKKDYSARKMLHLKTFFDKKRWGQALFDIIQLQTSPAV